MPYTNEQIKSAIDTAMAQGMTPEQVVAAAPGYGITRDQLGSVVSTGGYQVNPTYYEYVADSVYGKTPTQKANGTGQIEPYREPADYQKLSNGDYDAWQKAIYDGSVAGLQEILEPIAKGNYCLIEKDGLRAFCCFIMTNGLFTVVHAASEPGYMPQLVRLIKKTVKTTGVEWYRAKNNKIHRSMRERGTGRMV